MAGQQEFSKIHRHGITQTNLEGQMATEDQLNTLLAKAAVNKSFREMLASNPREAARSIGIELDEPHLRAFNTVSQKLKDATLDLNVREKVATIIVAWW